MYKINIYAVVVDSHDEQIESKELHEKVILVAGKLAIYSEEAERESVLSGGILSRQVSMVQWMMELTRLVHKLDVYLLNMI